MTNFKKLKDVFVRWFSLRVYSMYCMSIIEKFNRKT